MVKTWPSHEDPRVIRIPGPEMGWREVNLEDLRACCRRELAFRQRCYPRWVGKGMMTNEKAKKEIDLMAEIVSFLTHCVFKAVTRHKKEDSG